MLRNSVLVDMYLSNRKFTSAFPATLTLSIIYSLELPPVDFVLFTICYKFVTICYGVIVTNLTFLVNRNISGDFAEFSDNFCGIVGFEGDICNAM